MKPDREILQWSRWKDASDATRKAALSALADASNGVLQLLRHSGFGVFLHKPTNILLSFVPGGQLSMGIDDDERARLYAQYQFWDEADNIDRILSDPHLTSSPVVTVEPYLLAARCLGTDQLQWLMQAPEGTAPPRTGGRKSLDFERAATLPANAYIQHLEEHSRGTVSLAHVDAIERRLQTFGFRLPSDAAWEWAARAGSRPLFPSGDKIPKSPTLGVNPWGLLDMGSDSEVCADLWTKTLEHVPTDGQPRDGEPGSRVLHGGAASLYPWQGTGEWTLLLCGLRVDARSLDGFIAIRPAMGISQLW